MPFDNAAPGQFLTVWFRSYQCRPQDLVHDIYFFDKFPREPNVQYMAASCTADKDDMDDELDKSRRLDRMRKQLEAMLALLESSCVHVSRLQRDPYARNSSASSKNVQLGSSQYVSKPKQHVSSWRVGMSGSVSTAHRRDDEA